VCGAHFIGSSCKRVATHRGSVLGPLLFCMNTLPLEKIIKRHNISYYFYADDTKLYVSFVSSESQAAVAKLDHYPSDIRDWMADNFLKLNDDKTELILIGHPKRLVKTHDLELSVGSTKVKPSPCARNLGVFFDSSLSFNPFIQKTAATATFHIRSLVAIRDHLSSDLVRRLCASLVISRLDYCNAVVSGFQSARCAHFSWPSTWPLALSAKLGVRVMSQRF